MLQLVKLTEITMLHIFVFIFSAWVVLVGHYNKHRVGETPTAKIYKVFRDTFGLQGLMVENLVACI